jgi:hypothetical protein
MPVMMGRALDAFGKAVRRILRGGNPGSLAPANLGGTPVALKPDFHDADTLGFLHFLGRPRGARGTACELDRVRRTCSARAAGGPTAAQQAQGARQASTISKLRSRPIGAPAAASRSEDHAAAGSARS